MSSAIQTRVPHKSATAALMRMLSDEKRILIIHILAAGPRYVGDLTTELNLPQPTVSHHLGLLRINGLLKNTRQGKGVIYSLADSIRVTKTQIIFDLPGVILLRHE